MKKVNYQIYCDMDGVIVNFEDTCTDIINADLRDFSKVPHEIFNSYAIMKRELMQRERLTITKNDFSREAEDKIESVRNYMFERVQNNLEFWCNLPWKSDGKKLWEFIHEISPSPIILTAPMNGDNCIIGKKIWTKNNLGDYNIILNEQKYQHAKSNSILIDDYIENIIPWREKGGIAIHHKNTDDTIKELKNILQS